MPIPLIIGPIGAAAGAIFLGPKVAEGVGDFFDYATGREAEREEAKRRKAAARYRRDTILGQMERELAIKRAEAQANVDEALLGAAQGEGRLEQMYGANQQQAFLHSVAAEEQFLEGQGRIARRMGALAADRGASGLRDTGTVSDLIMTEESAAAAAIANQRIAIDAGMSAMVSNAMMNRQQGMDRISGIRSGAARTMAQFDPGSAYMDLYHFNRERVTGETALQLEYLQDVIDETYGWEGILGDVLRIGAGAGMGFVSTGGNPFGAALGGVNALFA